MPRPASSGARRRGPETGPRRGLNAQPGSPALPTRPPSPRRGLGAGGCLRKSPSPSRSAVRGGKAQPAQGAALCPPGSSFPAFPQHLLSTRPPVFVVVVNRLHFLEQFYVHNKILWKTQRFPLFPAPPAQHPTSSILPGSICCSRWTCTDKRHHPKPILCIRVALVRSVGLDKRTMTCAHHYDTTQSIVTAGKPPAPHPVPSSCAPVLLRRTKRSLLSPPGQWQ